MGAFQECQKVEAAGRAALITYLKKKSGSGRYVLTDKGRMSPWLQRYVGDALFNCPDGGVFGVEFKVEVVNRHGNLFLETWSNRERGTRGWLFTLDTDILAYHFLNEETILAVPFQRLKKWAIGGDGSAGIAGRYPEKMQGKYDQLNDTWGWCTPIKDVEREVGLRRYPLREIDVPLIQRTMF